MKRRNDVAERHVVRGYGRGPIEVRVAHSMAVLAEGWGRRHAAGAADVIS